jgi:ABC-type uncharacterized transport system permease subunit
MKEKKGFFQNGVVQSLLAALICIIIGVLAGYIVLLIINPAKAGEGIMAILKNFLNYPVGKVGIKYFGSTLIKTAPLIMCALSVCFCYKVGLFNIGAAGQYTLGAGVSLYAGLALHAPWYVCMVLAALGGALSGALVGVLKAFRNVNEVISGIMLNWISLYCVNLMLGPVRQETNPYTRSLSGFADQAIMPSLGLDKLFHNDAMTIAVPLAVVVAILIWVILNKTKFGYELVATGYNKDAAKYAGMKEKKNIIVTLAIGGGLAALGAAFYYLTGIEDWEVGQTAVPAMGFNGIAATFLGALHPIGTVFASFFIQHITDGAVFLDKTAYPSQIPDLITAIIIYLCGFMSFFRILMAKAGSRKKAEKKGGNK